MLDVLEQQQKLTTNQWKIISAAILGDMLDFFDYGLIAFALAFIVGHWKLTYGQSAMILLAAGVGAVPGALVWGWLADRIGRRTVFIGTALNFSIFTGIMALTPDAGGWIFLAGMPPLCWRRCVGLVCRRLAVGAGIRTVEQARLGRRDRDLLPAAGRHAGGSIGSLPGTLCRLARSVCDWFAAGVADVVDPRLGPGIAEMVDAHGPTRRGAQIACLGPADRRERHRAAQRHS